MQASTRYQKRIGYREKRFINGETVLWRVDGLQDQARTGRSSVMDEQTVKKVLKLTIERIAHDATHY